jgi:uncharacterized protein (DUF2336 family)
MLGRIPIGLDVTFLNLVIEKGGVDARRLLASQIAELLRDPEAAQIEKDQIKSVAQILAADGDKSVRSVLARELTEAIALPADLVFAIASDEEDIAKPFLETCRSLTPTLMVAILKAGDPLRQNIIIRRPDLSVEARNHVIRHGDVKSVLALMSNPVVQLTEPDLRAIFERLGNREEIIERLLAHPDLPPDIRIIQARRTASRLLQMLAENNWLSTSHARDVTADAEEVAMLKVIGMTKGKAANALLKFMADKNLLTPSLLVRAAAAGDMPVVEQILEHLSGHSPERTCGLIYGKSGNGFLSVFNKTGLPKSCFGVLRAACEVTREMRDEEAVMSPGIFGRRVLEALMTRYEELTPGERTRQIEFLSRYADESVRRIVRRLKTDLARAA